MLHGVLTKLFARLSFFFFNLSIISAFLPSSLPPEHKHTKSAVMFLYIHLSRKFGFFLSSKRVRITGCLCSITRESFIPFGLSNVSLGTLTPFYFARIFVIILYCWSCDFSLLFVFPQNILTKKMNKKRTTKNNANFYFTSGHFIFEYLSVERFVSTFESHASKIRTKPTNNSWDERRPKR